jgi:hypothetical protein
LLELGENAFPALVEASKSKDAEVAQRADAIVNKIREKLPSDRLDRPATDVVVTADGKFTGRISAEVFKVKTSQFGDQQVKLGDLASLGLKAFVEAEATLAEQPPPFGNGPGGRRPGAVRGPGGLGLPPGAGPGAFAPPPPKPPGQ